MEAAGVRVCMMNGQVMMSDSPCQQGRLYQQHHQSAWKLRSHLCHFPVERSPHSGLSKHDELVSLALRLRCQRQLQQQAHIPHGGGQQPLRHSTLCPGSQDGGNRMACCDGVWSCLWPLHSDFGGWSPNPYQPPIAQVPKLHY